MSTEKQLICCYSKKAMLRNELRHVYRAGCMCSTPSGISAGLSLTLGYSIAASFAAVLLEGIVKTTIDTNSQPWEMPVKEVGENLFYLLHATAKTVTLMIYFLPGGEGEIDSWSNGNAPWRTGDAVTGGSNRQLAACWNAPAAVTDDGDGCVFLSIFASSGMVLWY